MVVQRRRLHVRARGHARGMRLRRQLRPTLAPLTEYHRERNVMARKWRLPRKWIVCPACGEQSWVLPPHGLEPCPLTVQIAEQMGLKFDAERMMAVRTGVNFEEVAKDLRRQAEDENQQQ